MRGPVGKAAQAHGREPERNRGSRVETIDAGFRAIVSVIVITIIIMSLHGFSGSASPTRPRHSRTAESQSCGGPGAGGGGRSLLTHSSSPARAHLGSPLASFSGGLEPRSVDGRRAAVSPLELTLTRAHTSSLGASLRRCEHRFAVGRSPLGLTRARLELRCGGASAGPRPGGSLSATHPTELKFLGLFRCFWLSGL